MYTRRRRLRRQHVVTAVVITPTGAKGNLGTEETTVDITGITRKAIRPPQVIGDLVVITTRTEAKDALHPRLTAANVVDITRVPTKENPTRRRMVENAVDPLGSMAKVQMKSEVFFYLVLSLIIDMCA